MSKNTPSLCLHQSVNNPLYDTLVLKQETNEQIQLQQTKYKEKYFIQKSTLKHPLCFYCNAQTLLHMMWDLLQSSGLCKLGSALVPAQQLPNTIYFSLSQNTMQNSVINVDVSQTNCSQNTSKFQYCTHLHIGFSCSSNSDTGSEACSSNTW